MNDETEELSLIVGNGGVGSNAKLFVSFFGPFYAPYQIIEIGEIINGKYSYSIVSEPSRKNLWILFRDKPSDDVYDGIISRLKSVHGFHNLDKLILTDQNYLTEKYDIPIFKDQIMELKNIYETSSIKRSDSYSEALISNKISFTDLFIDIQKNKPLYSLNFSTLKLFSLNAHYHFTNDDIYINGNKIIVKSKVFYLTPFFISFTTDNVNEIRIENKEIVYHDETWYHISLFDIPKKNNKSNIQNYIVYIVLFFMINV